VEMLTARVPQRPGNPTLPVVFVSLTTFKPMPAVSDGAAQARAVSTTSVTPIDLTRLAPDSAGRPMSETQTREQRELERKQRRQRKLQRKTHKRELKLQDAAEEERRHKKATVATAAPQKEQDPQKNSN
jgi:hypothetical protein